MPGASEYAKKDAYSILAVKLPLPAANATASATTPIADVVVDSMDDNKNKNVVDSMDGAGMSASHDPGNSDANAGLVDEYDEQR